MIILPESLSDCLVEIRQVGRADTGSEIPAGRRGIVEIIAARHIVVGMQATTPVGGKVEELRPIAKLPHLPQQSLIYQRGAGGPDRRGCTGAANIAPLPLKVDGEAICRRRNIGDLTCTIRIDRKSTRLNS